MTRATSGKSSSIGTNPAWTKRRPRDSVIGARQSTATAMKATTLKQIPHTQFFARLSRDSLFEGFVRYLAVRIAEQQQVIANLVTVDSEQRLGKTLLQLARTMGKKNPHGLRIETKISHEELSEMVGTTRPRISMFMERFRKHGLLETNREHSLVVKEKKLADYLALRAAGHVCARRYNSCQNRPVLDSNLFRVSVS
jgi:CRP/FNR family transcriptional regulator, cyclic AMP receptor protein